jgi:DNA-damage-inducible protein J
MHYNVMRKQGGMTMAANALVQAQIDKAVKEEAAAVMASMGLTVSDAVRLMLTKIAKEHALPFEQLIPNELTVHAMKEARRGKLQPFEDVDALMADLNADD